MLKTELLAQESRQGVSRIGDGVVVVEHHRQVLGFLQRCIEKIPFSLVEFSTWWLKFWLMGKSFPHMARLPDQLSMVDPGLG